MRSKRRLVWFIPGSVYFFVCQVKLSSDVDATVPTAVLAMSSKKTLSIRDDSQALKSTLEFLRRHELHASETALVEELSACLGEGGRVDYGNDESAGNHGNSDVFEDVLNVSDIADDEDDDDEDDVDDDEDGGWEASILTRLMSVNLNGQAMTAIIPPDDSEDESRRAISSIAPYDIPTGVTHEEVLAHWRREGAAACEYEDPEDEGFHRASIARHDVQKYIVDSFQTTEDLKIEEDRNATLLAAEHADGNVRFSPEQKSGTVDGVSDAEKSKCVRVLDRGGSFSFADVSASAPPEDGVETPIPAGWVEKSRETFETFDLKVYHRPKRTGFENSKDFAMKYGDIVANRYRIVEGIGKAAFSKTVRAQDLQTDTPVCLKIVKNNKDYMDQGLDEIKLLKLMNDKDPNDEHGILRMLDYFYFKEHLFIVSELLRANLYEFQKYDMETSDVSYFSLARIQSVAKQVLKSLKFMHDLNLIHCDLKPENVLMRSYADCTVKVIDFGSSCFTTDQMSSYAQSRAYRAPEVIIGAKYSQKADIWSLGCILAELYTGQVLFRNSSVPTLLARMVSIRGPFDPRLLCSGTQSHKFFTREGFLYETEDMSGSVVVLRPKRTCLQKRIGANDEDFIDFIEKLLATNPACRLSAGEALEHPWMKKSLSDVVAHKAAEKSLVDAL
jgi:serine/threonine protein kinase